MTLGVLGTRVWSVRLVAMEPPPPASRIRGSPAPFTRPRLGGNASAPVQFGSHDVIVTTPGSVLWTLRMDGMAVVGTDSGFPHPRADSNTCGTSRASVSAGRCIFWILLGWFNGNFHRHRSMYVLGPRWSSPVLPQRRTGRTRASIGSPPDRPRETIPARWPSARPPLEPCG